MFSKDIALDLGSSNIRIFIPNKGLVVNEPSVVTVNTLTNEITAIGQKSYNMLGKTSDKLAVVNPITRGVISDFELAEQLIYRFFKKTYKSAVLMPRVVVSILGDMTEVEKRAVVNAVSTIGARKIYLIESPIAAAMGAGIDIFSPIGSLIIDVGSETTDIAVVSLSGSSDIKSIKIGGKDIDEAIIKYIKKEYALLIGFAMAEKIKNNIACAYSMPKPKKYEIRGRDILTGIPKRATISSDEIKPLCTELLQPIVSCIREILEHTEPELIGDIHTNGILLTGGLSGLYGLDKLINEATHIKVKIPEEADLCCVKGTGKAIKFIDSYNKGEFASLNPLLVEY